MGRSKKTVKPDPPTDPQINVEWPVDGGGAVLAEGDSKIEHVVKLSAQDFLNKSTPEIKEAQKADEESKREAKGLLKDLQIITAILLGKKKNKDLSKVLDTDKSYTSKQIKGLEEKGWIKKEVEGREVSYEVDQFNVLKFLQTKVVIKTGKAEGAIPEKKEGENDRTN